MAEATPAPAAAVSTQTAAPAAGQTEQTVDWKAKYEEAERAKAEAQRAFDNKKKEAITERRAKEAAAKTLGEKLSKLSEYEKREVLAKRNPTEYLKSIYGERWYDTVVEARLTGVAPAELVATELEKLEAKMEAKFSEREEAAKAERQRQQTEALQQSERDIKAQWGRGVSDEKHFALLARHDGDAQAAGAAAYEYAKQHWAKTAKYDDDGQWIQGTGEVLSFEKAAETLEAREREFAKKAYSRLTPEANAGSTPAKQQQGSGGQSQSKRSQVTLSNSITASSTGIPSQSRADRLKRAEAKYRELSKPKP